MTITTLELGVTAVESPLKICVLGNNYVGLTTAAGLAKLGHTVRFFDENKEVILSLLDSGNTCFEPGLSELMKTGRESGTLSLTYNPRVAVNTITLIVLCTEVSSTPEGDCNIAPLSSIARQLIEVSDHDLVFVVRSAVSPSSCERLEVLLRETARDRIDVNVSCNPEFLRAGKAVWDFLNPDRVIFGVDERIAAALMDRLYPSDWGIRRTDRRSAELIKHGANAFLAVKTSFANDIADLCGRIGADSGAVLAGIGADTRVGTEALTPGLGYFGSDLSESMVGLLGTGEKASSELKVLRSAHEVNEARPGAISEMIETVLGTLAGKKIAVLGLDGEGAETDWGNSPSLALIKKLSEAGAEISISSSRIPVDLRYGVRYRDDPYEAVAGSHAVVFSRDGTELEQLDFSKLASSMVGHSVFDLTGQADSILLAGCGLDLYGLGRWLSPDRIATKRAAMTRT